MNNIDRIADIIQEDLSLPTVGDLGPEKFGREKKTSRRSPTLHSRLYDMECAVCGRLVKPNKNVGTIDSPLHYSCAIEETIQEIGGELVITEALIDHLTRHFGEFVPPEQLQKAAEKPQIAMKLAYGLYKGIITDVDEPGADEKVANIKPVSPEKEQKQERKTPEEKQAELLKAEARNISIKYWPWIVKIWKDNGRDTPLDQSWFDYFDGNDFSAEDVLDKTPEEVQRESDEWHREEYANQEKGGTYTLSPKSKEAIQIGVFWFVPVPLKDAKTEGSKMQNCIGGICKPSDDTKIWSMRNKFNNPHVSISIVRHHGGTWATKEIKGKQNKRPIEKYHKPLLQFIEWITGNSKPLGMSIKVGGYDFWNIVGTDESWKWIQRVDDPVAIVHQRSEIIPALTSEQCGKFLSSHILDWQVYAAKHTAKQFENIIEKSDPKYVVELAKSQPVDQTFIRFAIKHRKVDKALALELAQGTDLRRSAKMIILSVYEPQRFVDELTSIDPEDLVLAIKNYSDAIEAFNSHLPYFAEVIKHCAIIRADTSLYKLIAPKVPDGHLGQFIISQEFKTAGSNDPYSAKIVMDSYLVRNTPVSNKVKIHKYVLEKFQVDISDSNSKYNYDTGDYDQHNEIREGPKEWLGSAPVFDITYCAKNAIGELKDVSLKLAQVAGILKIQVSQLGLEQFAERAEESEDIDELHQIHDDIPKKGPGPLLRLRRYILRKIARLERRQLEEV